MKAENTTRIQFDSLSVNEAYARGAAAAFLARYDPTVPQLADLKTAVSEAVTNHLNDFQILCLRFLCFQGLELFLIFRNLLTGFLNFLVDTFNFVFCHNRSLLSTKSVTSSSGRSP